MSRLRNLAIALIMAATFTLPTYAAGGPPISRACTRLADAIVALQSLASAYPSNSLITALLAYAVDTYATYCQ